MATLKGGDKVAWNTSQGPTRGTVVGTRMQETHVKNYTAKPAPGRPEVEVRSAKSGKAAVHRPESLKKVR
jgi:hypothetical protein